MKIISQTKFKVSREFPFLANEHERKALANLKLSSDYDQYDFDDISIKGSEIVLIK